MKNNRHERPARKPMGIRRGDLVRVMAGRDRDKFANRSARVLSVNAVRQTVTVEHAHMIKRHTRPNPQKNIKGGIVEREAPIHVSSVMLVCPGCSRAVRVGYAVRIEGGKRHRLRTCRRCGVTIDK